VIWRSVTIAVTVAGAVMLGILYVIGQSGCCGAEISKPVTGYATWARSPNPWVFGQVAKPAEKPHQSKADKGASDQNVNPAGLLSTLEPPGKGGVPPLPEGSSHVGDTSRPEFPAPPSGAGGGSGNTPPTATCSPVIDVLTGLASADCVQGAGGSDHNDSSGDHHSSGNGNNHSSNQKDSSQSSNVNATASASGPAANDNGHGQSNGNANGADNGNKDHGEKSQAKNHSNGRGGGNKDH
jgi:hypothetical protein